VNTFPRLQVTAFLPLLPIAGMLAGAAAAAPDTTAAVAHDIAWNVIVPAVMSLPTPTPAVDMVVTVVNVACVATIAMLGMGTVGVRAWDAYAPRVARAVGRHAFRVARAAYRMAR
jgi:hypothetical protein